MCIDRIAQTMVRLIDNGQLKIKDLVKVGVSKSNVYIIKNFDAETVPSTTGPKPKIPNALTSTIISRASDGTLNPFLRRGYG